MSRILVVDDDPDILNLLGAYLMAEGHSVEFAASGVVGVQAAVRAVPDLIITDFQMPQMDGFALFNAVRSTPQTTRVPVVMLTAHNSRALMLKALGMGLDDFVGKPITREELLKVVTPLLPSPAPGVPRAEPVTRTLAAARPEIFGTVVCCEIGRLESFMMLCSKAELGELLDQFRGGVEQAVAQEGGWLVRYKVHHLQLGFSDEGGATDHALRAVRCALKVVLLAQRLKSWIARRFAGRDLPEFLVGLGIHSGTIKARSSRAAADAELQGEAAEVAALLAKSIPKLRWSVAASRAAAQAANFQFVAGRAAKLPLVGGGTLEAVEVKSFKLPAAAKPSAAAAPAAPPDRSATLIEAAVDRNAMLVSYAAAVPKQPPAPAAVPDKAPAPPAAAPTAPPVGKPPASPPPRPPPAPAAKPAPPPAPAAPVRPLAPKAAPKPVREPAPQVTDPFAGRAVVRKLADNGVVAVTLVNPAGGGPQQVVKTILINDDKKGSKRKHLQKFVDQYATMQSVEHSHLARTFGQGLSATHLYVVQEYCPGGDLCNLIAQRMPADEALKAVLRIAIGLKALHQKGFIHGDLRPANVMIREDGSLAVVDFALASAIEYAVGEGESGVMLRSPEYLSPEMINGLPADVRSDIYCLGLLLHEMLTGLKPYASPDLSRVMMDHLKAPVPTLPAPHEKFQPLLDRMMAKKSAERFASVHDIIAFMAEAKLSPKPA